VVVRGWWLLTRGSDDAAFSNRRARGLPPSHCNGGTRGAPAWIRVTQCGGGGGHYDDDDDKVTTWSTGRPCAAHAVAVVVVVVGPIQHTQGMKRNREDVREEGGAVNQQQDWVVALQSPSVADKVADDIVRVLLQGYHAAAPGPDTLAFLEDMAQTLRLER
jgi:hypothetical protein